ncbi:unnamed protein product [Musa banksii]
MADHEMEVEAAQVVAEATEDEAEALEATEAPTDDDSPFAPNETTTATAASGDHKRKLEDLEPRDEAVGSARVRERAFSGAEPMRSARSASMRDLCRTRAHTKNEPFQALFMRELPDGEVDAPLEPRWSGLTVGSRVWTDGSSAATFVRGGLVPTIAKQLSSLSSEVLIEKAAKSLVWNQHYHMALIDRVHDAGRVISCMGDEIIELRNQIEELKVGLAAEQRAVDLEGEVAQLKLELGGAKRQHGELREKLGGVEQKLAETQCMLKESRWRVRSMEGKLLYISRNLEAAQVKAKKAEEALAEETRAALKKDEKAIAEYKESRGFQLGLQRTGQVTYEFGYRVALARFSARYPDLEIEEDPFVNHPEDDNVQMPDEVPFDDSVDLPEA